MFKIGDFSRLSQVPVKTLRYYDEIGLLKPAEVDRFTSYRYYSADQLPRLNRILTLKDLGLSLAQVGELLDGDLPAEQIRGMLRLKQAEAHQKVEDEQTRLARVEWRLREIEQEGVMSTQEVVLKKVAAMTVASLRSLQHTCSEARTRSSELQQKFSPTRSQNVLAIRNSSEYTLPPLSHIWGAARMVYSHTLEHGRITRYPFITSHTDTPPDLVPREDLAALFHEIGGRPHNLPCMSHVAPPPSAMVCSCRCPPRSRSTSPILARSHRFLEARISSATLKPQASIDTQCLRIIDIDVQHRIPRSLCLEPPHGFAQQDAPQTTIAPRRPNTHLDNPTFVAVLVVSSTLDVADGEGNSLSAIHDQ